MKRKLLPMIILTLLLLSSCSTPAPTGQTVEGPRPTSQAEHPDAIKRDAFDAYSATFNVNFDGPKPWKYQLIIRKSKDLHELVYHVEGIENQQKLGDVRMVTDGTTSWMIGPSTDNACVQFPANAGLDPTFIYPENILTMTELGKVANFVREEPLTGRNSMYYLVGPMVVGRWMDASVEYHQEKGSEALLQFAMLGTGDDNFFGTGKGTIMATYTVDSLEPPAIEPVTGCEISLPLPESAQMFVRMPGLASFESQQSADALVQFYQQQLSAANWVEVEPPAQSESAVVLSYRRDVETVEIQVEGNERGGTSVKMFFVEN